EHPQENERDDRRADHGGDGAEDPAEDVTAHPQSLTYSPRGSKMSRERSAMMLAAVTASSTPIPGNTPIHQPPVTTLLRPSVIIERHSGVGTWAPRPTNPSAAMARIAYPNTAADWISNVDVRCGTMWRSMIRPRRAPSARAASTKLRERMCSTSLRVRRA